MKMISLLFLATLIACNGGGGGGSKAPDADTGGAGGGGGLPVPLPSFAYMVSEASTGVGIPAAISPSQFDDNGLTSVCSISPALPVGVTIDSDTCEIEGTPVGTMAKTTYTVTLTNANGSADQDIDLSVLALATGAVSVSQALPSARSAHHSITLNDGRVMVVGGQTTGNVKHAPIDVFNPIAGTWATPASLVEPRSNSVAIKLNDGKVLIAGGRDVLSDILDTAEIFDPALGTISSAGVMPGALDEPRGSLLKDGRVLVTGGYDTVGNVTAAYLYNPATNAWLPAAPMQVPRSGHSQVTLDDGSVIVIAGEHYMPTDTGLSSTEIYDPATNSWSFGPSIGSQRAYFNAVTLNDGNILIFGGITIVSAGLVTSEVLNIQTGVWSPSGNMSAERDFSVATVLGTGEVLVAGGFSVGTEATAEIYNPALGTFGTPFALAESRMNASVSALNGGGAIVIGGGNGAAVLTVDLVN